MRQSVIAGNWKMHGTRASVSKLLEEIKSGARAIANVEWIVFSPFVFLEQTAHILQGSNVHWGAQNLNPEASGAFTGEISGSMLQEFGCEYVIVGHSERRQLYGETDAIVAKKFIAAKQTGLKPILCLGETLKQRESLLTHDVVLQQLNAILTLPEGVSLLKDALLAYEPVWAIGTGLTATPEQAQEVHHLLRQQVASFSKEIAEKLPILYGGSVKAGNASQLFAMPDIDGGLVGGASLDAKEFIEIARSFPHVKREL